MAEKVRIEFLSEGFHEILCSQECEALVSEEAAKIAARAGEGHEARTKQGNYGGGRVIGIVETATYEAMAKEAVSKNLSKAVM